MTNRQTPRHMKRLLAQRERHGWSWAELSRRSGLPYWKLHWWHQRLSAVSPAPRRRRTFASVRIVESATGPPSQLELVLPSGLRILVPGGFDADHLRRVLGALGPAC